jgi:hypothetical protein
LGHGIVYRYLKGGGGYFWAVSWSKVQRQEKG